MAETSRESLSFCPDCGTQSLAFYGGKCWKCSSCGFTLYQNVAASVALILEYNGKILTVVRGKNPKKGMLALPGGFIDPLERAEDAALRECAEETGLRLQKVDFFCTFPNTYEYKKILYNTCDIFFTVKIDGTLFTSDQSFLDSLTRQESEIDGFTLLKKSEIPQADIAFDSIRKALELYARN